ncbi:hypothetical protein ABTK13_23420, partial [Acinetobacter baumannii]
MVLTVNARGFLVLSLSLLTVPSFAQQSEPLNAGPASASLGVDFRAARAAAKTAAAEAQAASAPATPQSGAD